MKKQINILSALLVLAFTLQACFQEMEHPAFDYPDSSIPKVFSPLKMMLPFEGTVRDKGNYTFLMTSSGTVTYTEGVNGKAYKGTKDSYMLARVPAYLTDSVAHLKSCTIAFWMKSAKNTTAVGVFSIPNTKSFWGNFDIFLENNPTSDTQAFFKVHLYNQTAKENDERWVEARVDNVFGTEWVHLAFVYDGSQSRMTIYRNGASVLTHELPGCGELKFNNLSPVWAIGAFQFSTKPSLTTGATAQAWATNYPGEFDQFRFYDRVVTAADIQKLYTEKE